MTKTHVPKPRPMNLSNIGYKGVGSDGKAMGWYYGWNPGGFGCSKNCDGCWSKAMARRINGTGRPFCKACATSKCISMKNGLISPNSRNVAV